MFKKLSRLFAAPARADQNAYWIYVRCNRCGETLCTRVDLINDLSLDYEEDRPIYLCRKVLIGERRCFQPVEVWLKFDQNRRLIDQEITQGVFISREEYQQDQNLST